MPVKIYQYGLGKNIEGPERVLPEKVFEQFRLQHQFWNALVEIEKKYDVKYEEIRSRADNRLVVLNDQIERLVDSLKEIQGAIKKQRQKARKVVPVDAGLKKQVADIKKQLQQLKEERKGLRHEVKHKIKPQTDEMNRERQAEINDKRREFSGKGLYWCNYNAVIDSMRVACTHVYNKRRRGEAAGFNFRSFNGKGRLTVQFIKTSTFKNLLNGENTQLQIDHVPPEAWESPVRAERRRVSRTTGRIRIGSEGSQGRDPVWFEFPIILHRPVPDNAKIKKATVTREKMGLDWKWELNLVVQMPECESVHDARKKRYAGVDIGWRKTKEGLRVAAWFDSDGKYGDFKLDNSYVETQERLDGLKAAMDKNREEVRAHLLEWCKKKGSLPEWLVLQKISTVNSHQYFLFISRTWENNRLEDDEEILQALTQWKARYVHLYSWRSNLSRKLRNRRKESFRLFSKKMAEKYTHIFLQELNLGRIRKKHFAEDGPRNMQRASNKWANVASPGSLREELRMFCQKNASKFITGNSKNASRTCPFCNHIVQGDTLAKAWVTCHNCNNTYDQDVVAALYILRKGMIENI